MKFELAKNISLQIQEVARGTGINEEEIITNAILLYLDSISKQVKLKKELNSLDKLSDEALLNFEAQI